MFDEDFAIESSALRYAARQVAQRAAADGGDYAETYNRVMAQEESDETQED